MRFAYATGSRPLDGYTIKRGIGVGGFGEVYFALSDAGKEVALKRVQRSMDVEVRGVSQCLNLKHPHLISLFDIKYDDEGQAWVVMEYVTGESLKDVIERNPNGMPVDDVEWWFGEIAAGVAYLHDHGIVHRDLKPGNIFLDEEIVKIGDYGLSKYISCSRRSGQTESVGTFHYMAPEIGKGVYGKEIDIYALGIILYEMLCGRVPFDGESSQEIMMKHLTADPDLAAIPGRFRAVIGQALSKDPEDRFAGVAEMRAAWRAAQAGPEPAAVPPVRRAPPAEPQPLYIADEDEGIFLGPLKEIAQPAKPVAARRPEPIAAAVGKAGSRTASWWRHSRMSTWLKLLLIVVLALVCVWNYQWLLPLGVILGALYLVYFGVYSLVSAVGGGAKQPTRPASPGERRPVAQTAAAPQRKRRPRRKWQEAARVSLRKKHSGERLAELNGSFLMSAIVVAVLCFLMLLFKGDLPLEGSVYTWSLYAWLTLTCTAAAWAVLGVNKLWESREGDHFRRRFVMLLAGMALGAVAFAASEFLDVRRPGYLALERPADAEMWPGLYGPQGQPELPVFLIYFGVLFLILRWWLQADPVRASRLSLTTTGACVLGAWLLHVFLRFPQPWGIMMAGAISVAVQLSAPWFNSQQRSQFRQQQQVVDVV